MKRLFLVVSLFMIVSSLSAAIYKGHRIYIKQCATCHIEKESFLKSKTIKEWEALLIKNGKPLKDIHLKNPKAKPSLKYFNSRKYAKKLKHLRDFFREYAKDSGKIPAFN